MHCDAPSLDPPLSSATDVLPLPSLPDSASAVVEPLLSLEPVLALVPIVVDAVVAVVDAPVEPPLSEPVASVVLAVTVPPPVS